MFRIRPHTIQFKITEGGGQDENGNPIEVIHSWSDPISCRFDTDNRELIYKYEGGSALVYSYVVYIDPVSESFVGRTVRLIDQYGNVKEEDKKVQKCVNGQLATKLYL